MRMADGLISGIICHIRRPRAGMPLPVSWGRWPSHLCRAPGPTLAALRPRPAVGQPAQPARPAACVDAAGQVSRFAPLCPLACPPASPHPCPACLPTCDAGRPLPAMPSLPALPARCRGPAPSTLDPQTPPTPLRLALRCWCRSPACSPACLWRCRLLNALPANRVTATAVDAVLKVAGYRMHLAYRGQFSKLLQARLPPAEAAGSTLRRVSALLPWAATGPMAMRKDAVSICTAPYSS